MDYFECELKSYELYYTDKCIDKDLDDRCDYCKAKMIKSLLTGEKNKKMN